MCVYMYILEFIYIYIYIERERGYAPFRRAWAVGFGTWEGAFRSHVGVFWGPSWGLWRFRLEVWEPFLEAFGGHVGRLGTNLSQHKAILSHLGGHLVVMLGYLGNLWGPFWASRDQLEPTKSDLEPSWNQLETTLSQHDPNMSQHGAPGTPLDGPTRLRLTSNFYGLATAWL